MRVAFSLQLIQGNHTIQTLDGSNQIIRIGSAANNDLRLPDGPDYAAELRPGDDGVYLYLLVPPAAVDGIAVDSPVCLHDFQTITLGDYQIRFTLNLAATAAFDKDILEKVRHLTQVQPQQVADHVPDETSDHLGALLGEARLVNLETRLPNGQWSIKVLRQPSTVVGISPDAGLVVPDIYAFVSRQHFRIEQDQDTYSLIDLGSVNGTYLNAELVTPGQPYALQDRDVIYIGDPEQSFGLRFIFHNPRTVAPVPGMRVQQPHFALSEGARVSIGRNPGSDIVLDDPMVSGEHAIITRTTEGVTVAAREGRVIVNGTLRDETRLQPGDYIEIADNLLEFDGEALTIYNSRGYRLDLIGGYKEIQSKGKTRRILNDINLSVLPHEFVALVGGSGAGKSTLMDGLNGFRPIKGRLIVNNRDFYQHYDEFRPLLGYVPQYDILPRTLTVEAALGFAARLRLPPHLSRAEREQRITQVLDTVDMNTERIRQTRIGALSGGQRKRVSIAAELLADPKLFFLDEPTSGLDPGLEKKMMALLRRMADQGRTIILVTHATSNIVETDHVLFLSEGQMVFYGPPDEARRFFGVQDFADIYERIQGAGDKWHHVFTQAEPYQANVVQRQAQIPAEESRDRLTPRATVRQQAREYWRQFVVYVQRNLRITLSDPVSLFVGLIVMPLIGLLGLGVMTAGILVGDADVMADPAAAAQTMSDSYFPATEAHIEVFTIALLAMLVGAFAGSNDLLKERAIYLRERLVNLKIPSYLASKYVVFGGFAVVQSVLYLLVYCSKARVPDQGMLLPGIIEIWFSIFLVIMVGYAFGLLISAISVSSDVALYLVLILVFFQYICAGAIYNLKNADPVSKAMAYAAPTRWGSLALGTTLDLQSLLNGTILCGEIPEVGAVCQHKPLEASVLYLPYGNTSGELLANWATMLVMGGILTLITYLVLRRYDRMSFRLT